MIKNFIWSLANIFILTGNSLIPIYIISRYINPISFLDLNVLYSISILGNIIIDYGQSQKCLLRKNINNKSFERIESYMLFRTLLCFICLFLFAIFKNYFNQYSIIIIILIANNNFVSFLNFRPRVLFNKLKLFKLRAKYSLFSSLISGTVGSLISIYWNPNLGYILLLALNPIIIGFLMRCHLKIKIPRFKIKIYSNIKGLLKIEFLNQVLDNLEDLIKKFFIQNLPNINQSAIYLRNETFLFSPFRIFNKSSERVILSTWGPLSKLKGRKILIFLLSILLITIVFFIFLILFGPKISILFLGEKWGMLEVLFTLATIIITMKFIKINLSTLIKVKSKKYNFLFFSSMIFVFIPAIIIISLGIKELTTILYIYALGLITRNIVLIFHLFKLIY